MKKNINIETELNHRKYTIPNGFQAFAYRFVGKGFVLPKYNFHCTIEDSLEDCKGPCFLIWNHQSRRDHLFLMKAAGKRRLSILAGYNEFFRSHLAGVFKFQHIIPKKNFASDVISIRGINSIIKQGGCVAFSPEGTSSVVGHNQPIVPGTGHFIKHFGIPVYFLELKGAYLTNNKICEDDRPGRVEGRLSLLFSPEMLESMTDDEVQERIDEVFKIDDYEWNKTAKIRFKSRGRICTHLNDILYKCPRCGAELTMKAGGDRIECTSCGNGATMDDYYTFHPFDDKCAIPESPSKWFDWQRECVIKEIRKDPNYSFSVHCKIGTLPTDHYLTDHKTSELCGEGTVTVDHSGLHFEGTKNGEAWSFTKDYNDMYTLLNVTDVSFFSQYINGKYHDFFPDTPCVGKIQTTVEEMHRLHVNKWKNFPWCNYMYEGLDQEAAEEGK